MHTYNRVLGGLCLALASAAACAQSNGVYWKVEGGYGWTQNAKVHDKAFNTGAAAICGDPACVTPGQLNDIGNAWVAGAGVGWRFDPQFRTDFVVTYRGGMKLTGTDAIPNFFNADISSWSGMLNGYWDIPWSPAGIRPFVGAGLGYARNHMGTLTVFFPGFPAGNVSSGDSNNVAVAVTAGLGWQVTKGFAVDLAYRYTNLGHIDSGTLASIPAVGVGAQFGGVQGNLKTNELTLGVRF